MQYWMVLWCLLCPVEMWLGARSIGWTYLITDWAKLPFTRHSAENSPDEWCIAIYSIHKAFEYDICGVRWNLISHFAQCNTCRVVSLQQIVIAIFSPSHCGLRKLSNGKRDATCTELCFVCKLMRWRWWFTTDQTPLVSRFCPPVHFLSVAQLNAKKTREIWWFMWNTFSQVFMFVKRRNTVDNVNVHVAPKWKKILNKQKQVPQMIRGWYRLLINWKIAVIFMCTFPPHRMIYWDRKQI